MYATWGKNARFVDHQTIYSIIKSSFDVDNNSSKKKVSKLFSLLSPFLYN